jgi:hypothetical protein
MRMQVNHSMQPLQRVFSTKHGKPAQHGTLQYMAAYTNARAAGADLLLSHATARSFADQGRPTGFIGNSDLFKSVAGKPISQGGGLFLDQSRLNVFEGQYNLSDDSN